MYPFLVLFVYDCFWILFIFLSFIIPFVQSLSSEVLQAVNNLECLQRSSIVLLNWAEFQVSKYFSSTLVTFCDSIKSRID